MTGRPHGHTAEKEKGEGFRLALFGRAHQLVLIERVKLAPTPISPTRDHDTTTHTTVFGLETARK
jgi:hypothetical protein